MKNVNLNDVRGFEKITNVSVDLSALPKVGLSGKNNRIHTCTTVNNGTHYCLPTFVELIANGEKLCCELKPRLIQMIKIDNSNYRCIVKDEILGSFVVRFDDLLRTKTFANKIKEEILRHLKNIEDIAQQVDKAKQLANESNRRATEYNEKYTTEYMAHEKTKDDLCQSNQLAEQRLNQIMLLTAKISTMELEKSQASYGEATKHKDIIIRNLPRIVKSIIRLHKEGLSIDAIVEKIAKAIDKMAE